MSSTVVISPLYKDTDNDVLVELSVLPPPSHCLPPFPFTDTFRCNATIVSVDFLMMVMPSSSCSAFVLCTLTAFGLIAKPSEPTSAKLLVSEYRRNSLLFYVNKTLIISCCFKGEVKSLVTQILSHLPRTVHEFKNLAAEEGMAVPDLSY